MTSPLFGQMMDVPLLVSSLLSHASRHFGDTEIVSRALKAIFIDIPIAIAKNAPSNWRRR